LLEIDIATAQMERFRNAQAGGGDQSQQCLVGNWPQSTKRGKAPSGGDEITDLLLRVDVRRQATMGATKDCRPRELGGWIEPSQISGEWPKNFQASRPGKRHRMLCLTLHPIQSDASRQRAGMAGAVDETRECLDLIARDAEVEPQGAALVEVILGQ
jgi:hypothetical protein